MKINKYINTKNWFELICFFNPNFKQKVFFNVYSIHMIITYYCFFILHLFNKKEILMKIK